MLNSSHLNKKQTYQFKLNSLYSYAHIILVVRLAEQFEIQIGPGVCFCFIPSSSLLLSSPLWNIILNFLI